MNQAPSSTIQPFSASIGLTERLERNESIRLGVIGLGYVGLPLALKAAWLGHRVAGIDINPALIESLKAKQSPLGGLPPGWLQATIADGRLVPVLVPRDGRLTDSQAMELAGIDVFVVCVHTPLAERGEDGSRQNEPDISWIRSACRVIERVYEVEGASSVGPRERLIVLESTTYPGTTREVFGPLLERFGSRRTKTFLAYSPERSNPAPKLYEESESDIQHFLVPRVVGGLDLESRRAAIAFYISKGLFRQMVPVSSLEAAELVKLSENTFRFLSIAFAIELSEVARGLKLDVWEIINAVKTKPFGLDPCTPGLIGGHCIPIDPLYLEWFARERIAENVQLRLVQEAQLVHDRFRQAAKEMIEACLERFASSGAVSSTRSVHFFGVTYKADVADTRESAVKELMVWLAMKGIRISYSDPVLEANHLTKDFMVELSESEYDRITRRAAGNDTITRPTGDGGRPLRFLVPQAVQENEWDASTAASCVVLAVDHAAFRATLFKKLVTPGGPPIVDLCYGMHRELDRLETSEHRAALEAVLKERCMTLAR
jgi:UDP-N-acetyl-D-glucosamine dehydrogenase